MIASNLFVGEKQDSVARARTIEDERNDGTADSRAHKLPGHAAARGNGELFACD